MSRIVALVLLLNAAPVYAKAVKAAKAKGGGEIKALLLGGAWVAGSWLKPEQTIAENMGRYLSEFSGRKVKVINAAFPHDSPSRLIPRLQKLIVKEKPDFVFYFVDHPYPLVALSAEEYWLQRDEKNVVKSINYMTEKSFLVRLLKIPLRVPKDEQAGFVRRLNLEVGAVNVSRKLETSNNRARDLLRPFLLLNAELTRISKENGAKYLMLWPGLGVSHRSWVSIPNNANNFLITSLNYMKSKVLVSPEGLLRNLRNQNLRWVANVQVSKFLSPMDPEKVRAPETADQVAKMLATSIYATEF